MNLWLDHAEKMPLKRNFPQDEGDPEDDAEFSCLDRKRPASRGICQCISWLPLLPNLWRRRASESARSLGHLRKLSVDFLKEPLSAKELTEGQIIQRCLTATMIDYPNGRIPPRACENRFHACIALADAAAWLELRPCKSLIYPGLSFQEDEKGSERANCFGVVRVSGAFNCWAKKGDLIKRLLLFKSGRVSRVGASKGSLQAPDLWLHAFSHLALLTSQILEKAFKDQEE